MYMIQHEPASGLTQVVLLSPDNCMCCRSASLKPPIAHNPQDALAELRELGPLGIPPSSSSDASTDPFASPLVTHAFTDVPIVPTGRYFQCLMLCDVADSWMQWSNNSHCIVWLIYNIYIHPNSHHHSTHFPESIS